MAEWQKLVYGDTDAARAALTYFRERAWPVDDETFPSRDDCERVIRPFIAGYKVASQERGR